MRAPIASTFASLCCRASRAVSSDHATAARTPGTLLAVIAMPVPEPQTNSPCSTSTLRNLFRNLARIVRIIHRLFRHRAEIVKLDTEIGKQRLQALLLGVTSMIACECNSHVSETFVEWCVKKKRDGNSEHHTASKSVYSALITWLRFALTRSSLSENAKSMRWSQYFIPTLREDPADAEVVSHKLLLRAGVIRQLSAGIYSYLPLGQRIALKVMQILREEMNAIGGQEFYLPALHPAEIWQESGRWDAIGDEMFRLKDRKGTDMCLGMTHEEVFTTIARNELRSYKQLPQVWYQIQIKFRDEARPKSGLMRLRTFIMKDAYSFDVDRAGLDKSFIDQREAYKKIFTRCGITVFDRRSVVRRDGRFGVE